MPRIAEYTNKVEIDPGPLAVAAHRVGIAGQEEGNATRQVGAEITHGLNDVEEHVAQNETSKLAADFATTQAALTSQWNDLAAKADPNDHDLAQRFLNETAGPAIDKLGDSISTPQAQDMFTKASAGLKAHLFTIATADQSNLAGAAAVANLDVVKNQLSNLVRDDPTSFDGSINMAKLTIGGLVSAYHLPSDKALALTNEVNGEIAKSAIIGMADRNPDAAKAALASGKFDSYIDGTTAKVLSNYADEQSRAQTTAQKAAETEQRRQEKDQFNGEASKLMAGMVMEDGSLRVPPDMPSSVVKLAMLPGAEPGEVRSLIDMTARITKDHAEGRDIQTDPHTYESFSQRLLLPSSDPNALTQRDVITARTLGVVSDRDFTFFNRSIEELNKDPAKREADKLFNAFLQSQKSAFTQRGWLTGVADPEGSKHFFEFSQAARAQYEAAYAQGKARDVLDARNPAFLGRLAGPYLHQKGAAPAAPVARISGDDDFAKLPHGAQFVGPDGVLRVKP